MTRLLTAALLGTLATLAARAQEPAFEVASIKPTIRTPIGKGGAPMARGSGGVLNPQGARWQALNISLPRLIRFAYGRRNVDGEPIVPLEEARLIGGPSWMDDAVFDIEARMPERTHAPGDSALMVRALLAERFALRAHEETRELRVYALEQTGRAAPASRLRPASETCVARAARIERRQIQCGIRGGPERISGDSVTMARLGVALAPLVGRPVIDRTGLTGTFDFLLRFAAAPGDPNGQLPIGAALEEQLGLTLVSRRAELAVVVIDHVEWPAAN